MEPPVVASTTITRNYNGASSISPRNTSSPLLTNQDNTRDDDLTIWLEEYWQRMLVNFKQLKLSDFEWLEPIKDVVSQAECILHQILYPGIDTSNNAAQHKTYQEPDMLDEVIDKLWYITLRSTELIRLFRPFVQEIVEEESGTFVRLINRSDQLENVLTNLKEKVSIMKTLNAKDVRLDMLLYNFRDVTKDRRLFHDHSIGEVIRKMAESIYICKNSISFLCMETNQSTMVEFDISTLQKVYRHHRYYINTIEKLVHLARQLLLDLYKIKRSRDHLFNKEFSNHLIEIMEAEKEVEKISGTFKNHHLDQYHSMRLKAFLNDNRVLQQAYNHWKEQRRQKYVIDTVPKEHSISDTSCLEFDPKNALDVVLQWDPFNSMSCIGHAEVSVHIFSLAESVGSSSINNLQTYTKTILQVASSCLNDLFHCLINANAAFHNVEVIHAYAYAQHPSRWFCASSGASSSGERESLCFSSYSSSHSASLSSHPINIPTPKIHQQRPTFEIEPTYEKERTYDERIFYLFGEAISNLKQLANILVHIKCGHVLSKAFREGFQASMEQKLPLLRFYQGAKEKLENLRSMEVFALRERRRDWEQAFKVVVYALLPWPKYLCDEIFPDGTEELKEICFYEYAIQCLMPLLEFADPANFSISGQVERIFHQLHVHEVLSELSANIPTLFSGSESRQLSFSRQVMAVLMRLEKAIMEAFVDFNSQLQDDKSCINQNEVHVHHLTHSTMSYVKELSRHRITINSILSGEVSFSSTKCSLLSDQSSSYNSDACIGASDCRELMLLLLSCLESTLMQKSEVLKASVAKQVFWINNLDYMIEEAVNPQLKIVLGEEWVQERNKKIKGYVMGYEESVLTEVQSCLNASKGSSRKRLKSFKLSVEDICKVRASWKVPNPRWRCLLRNVALNAVVSVYANFRDKVPPRMLKTKMVGLAQLIKVDPVISIEEDLEGLKSILLDLFEG